MAIDADEFRAAMGAWPSGVTIITARVGEKIHGMTVSDFSGASLDPPLALVCASKTSNTTAMIQEGENFGVNVLRVDQDALSNKFASKKNLDCRLIAVHDAGDHVLCVGEIEMASVNEGEPLLYFKGGYGRFEPKG